MNPESADSHNRRSVTTVQEVCGAFSGACAVISYLNSDGSIEAKTKRDTYRYIQEAAEDFKAENGSIICREILNGNKPVHLKCSDRITDAVELVEEYIKTKKEN